VRAEFHTTKTPVAGVKLRAHLSLIALCPGHRAIPRIGGWLRRRCGRGRAATRRARSHEGRGTRRQRMILPSPALMGADVLVPVRGLDAERRRRGTRQGTWPGTTRSAGSTAHGYRDEGITVNAGRGALRCLGGRAYSLVKTVYKVLWHYRGYPLAPGPRHRCAAPHDTTSITQRYESLHGKARRPRERGRQPVSRRTATSTRQDETSRGPGRRRSGRSHRTISPRSHLPGAVRRT